MKANHNFLLLLIGVAEVVVNISISKNESKSQLSGSCFPVPFVVVNISISKNESKV